VRWLLLLGLLVTLAAAPAARADADPASDVLYTENVFLPYNNDVPESLARALRDATEGAKKAGFPIKVAVIASKNDLGLIYTLWRKPKLYAAFLGRELLFLYHDTLIVVMPNGFGVFRDNKPVDREQRLLATIKTGEGATRLAQAALLAVQRLAKASGHPIGSGSGSGGFVTLDRVLIAVGALVLLTLLILGSFRTRRRRLKLGPQEQEDDDPGQAAKSETQKRSAQA
jgi:hypothetical protein